MLSAGDLPPFLESRVQHENLFLLFYQESTHLGVMVVKRVATSYNPVSPSQNLRGRGCGFFYTLRRTVQSPDPHTVYASRPVTEAPLL